MTSIVNRGDLFDKDGLKNQWKWEWILYKVGQERVGDSIHKMYVPVSARCIAACKADFSYHQSRFYENLMFCQTYIKTELFFVCSSTCYFDLRYCQIA